MSASGRAFYDATPTSPWDDFDLRDFMAELEEDDLRREDFNGRLAYGHDPECPGCRKCYPDSEF